MAGIALSQVQARRQRLLDLLPEHDWSIIKAGIAAGYSKKYATNRLPTIIKNDVGFCEQVAAKQTEIRATQGERIEKLVRSWEKLAHDPTVSTRDRLKAGELLGKYFAIFSERRVLEVPDRQRVLTEAEQEECKRLALLRFQTTRALPDEVLQEIESAEGPPASTPTACAENDRDSCAREDSRDDGPGPQLSCPAG